jgi:drug/metabolite transporter (DMT)-like permease
MVIGLGEALSLGCALTWAVGVIIYKRLGEQLPPLKLCLLKNLIVLALVVATVAVLASPLAPVLGLQRLPMPALDGASILLALASGVIGIAVADTLYLRALNVLGAGRMGVVGNLFSPFVILLSVMFLGEQLGPVQWLGFALVMAGVVLVNAPDRLAQVDPAALRRGLATGALAVALMAVAIVMVKQVLEDEPFWWIVLLRIAGAMAGLRGSGQPTRWGVLVVAALVGQYLSMAMWLGGYKYTDASVASVLNETASVFIVLFAAIFLGEALSRRRVLGVLVTLAGVACMV